MAVVKEEETMKQKGPWSEQEDLQLVCFVRLFGLNRTGKSCRLRWVNYLHPGLKRGRMTPQEERLVLELHSRWGNRWSRIARRLPGRTDNEIKNYWRTHMRKMARERKGDDSPLASSLTATDRSASSGEVDRESPEFIENGNCSSYKTMGLEEGGYDGIKCYPMDQIWEEIETSETMSGLSFNGSKDAISGVPYPSLLSPAWDCCYDWVRRSDDEELRKLHTVE